MVLCRGLRNPILLQILTLRILCVTSSLRNVGRRGPERKRSTRSTRTKHLRRDEHGRSARERRRRKRNCQRESLTPCVVWKCSSNPWEALETRLKERLHEGAEAEVFHRLGRTTAGQDEVGHPDRTLLVHVEEVRAGPGLRGEDENSDWVPLRFAYSKDCCAIEYTSTGVRIRSGAYLNLFEFPVRPFSPRY